MKRLTKKRDGENVIPLRQDGKTKWLLASAGLGEPSTHFLYGEYADKLANYENTGLTPEQIIEMDKLYAEKCKELAEYKRLEEKGLLLKLPCKVGTKVWYINERLEKQGRRTVTVFFVDDGSVDNITLGGVMIPQIEVCNNKENSWITFDYKEDWNKTVFLTQAEAEEALKK